MECRPAASALRACSEAPDTRRDKNRNRLEVRRSEARRSNAAERVYQQARLCARVSLIINFLQMIAGNMRINLSCRDIGMAQHFLN